MKASKSQRLSLTILLSLNLRMYLTPYDLTPTYRNIHNKFSVRYSLNLVLVDQVWQQ